MLDGTEFFECECSSDEHTLRFVLDLDENPPKTKNGTLFPRHPELYTGVFLNHHGYWYHRLWRGLKYIVGYKCKYGHFDQFLLQEEDAKRLINLVERFVSAREDAREESRSGKKGVKTDKYITNLNNPSQHQIDEGLNGEYDDNPNDENDEERT